MDTTTSRFTLRKNAKRAAEAMIRKGTGPAISHWPVSSSVYPIQLSQATKPMAPKSVSNTKSGTLVPAAAGA